MAALMDAFFANMLLVAVMPGRYATTLLLSYAARRFSVQFSQLGSERADGVDDDWYSGRGKTIAINLRAVADTHSTSVVPRASERPLPLLARASQKFCSFLFPSSYIPRTRFNRPDVTSIARTRRHRSPLDFRIFRTQISDRRRLDSLSAE